MIYILFLQTKNSSTRYRGDSYRQQSLRGPLLKIVASVALPSMSSTERKFYNPLEYKKLAVNIASFLSIINNASLFLIYPKLLYNLDLLNKKLKMIV